MSSPVTQAIILAGGLGTRLRDAVPDVPKCLAPVRDRPFLEFVIDHLKAQGINRFVFALGYGSTQFIPFIEKKLSPAEYKLSIEEYPLGTGGAIKKACSMCSGRVLVVNGDSLFKTPIKGIAEFMDEKQAECVLLLKLMHDYDRYGSVELDDHGYIGAFREKQFMHEGLINTGVYLIDIAEFLGRHPSYKFSFEKDYLEKFQGTRALAGLVREGYFIDIGVPEDYVAANSSESLS